MAQCENSSLNLWQRRGHQLWPVTLVILLTMTVYAHAQPIQNMSNSHYYDIVFLPGATTWSNAQEDASSRTWQEVPGHLATLTTIEELDFVMSTLLPRVAANLGASHSPMWLGGFRPEQDTQDIDGWQWITGEEFDLTNWATFAPNERSREAGLVMLPDGTWDDRRQASETSAANPMAYLIEFDTTLLPPVVWPEPEDKPPFVPIGLPNPQLICLKQLQVYPRYTDETLTLEFNLQINGNGTLNAWLVAGNQVDALLSVNLLGEDRQLLLPISYPYFPPQGTVGVLTTITRPREGIICSKFVTINTRPTIDLGPGQLPLITTEP